MKREEYETAKKKALEYYSKCHIYLTEFEKGNLEIADFGLGDYEHLGLAVTTYVNTERCCAKELVLLPNQTCPEHTHIAVSELNYEGKEETFRCRYGTVYLYIEGEPSVQTSGKVPSGYEESFTIKHEIILREGEQYTLSPNTKHWFQACDSGAVISEFSTKSLDAYDVFTDRNIKRLPSIEE